jgi:dTDP-4-amino-4,6-dideoxygalactose transaminase
MGESEAIPEAALAEIERLLRSGQLFRYAPGPDDSVSVLEREFAGLIGSRFALAVSSCSAALFLTIRALDLPPETPVLIPAFTFAAVPSAVLHAGCVPVLVEVGENYRVDIDDFRRKLAMGAGAVMISHMRGHTSDMDAILSLSSEYGVPVIEDAAHSLGTRWHGRRVGTLARAGCFSFQSYKLVNGGEGGMLVTDDPELIARAVIMSGAYEQNWRRHDGIEAEFLRWQNRLPLYNMRMSNLSAAVIRAQLDQIDGRVRAGRRNHDLVAGLLRRSPWFELPAPLAPEERAPDSIQFNLRRMSNADVEAFIDAASARGAQVQVFGLSADNARAFWNWKFLGDVPELPRTRAMLMRACDLRLPTHLSVSQCETMAAALIGAAEDVMAARAYGT